jgi:uncharacterized repeat protein (TIGR01451 family)
LGNAIQQELTMKSTFAISALLILTILLGIQHIVEARVVQSTSDLNWYTQVVDQFDQYGPISNHSLRLDSQGLPRIVYAARHHIYYGRYDGAQWSFEIVDELGGTWPALALDSADNPHIIYGINGILKYAHWTGSTWSIQTLASGVNSGSLALDAAGLPHISYEINNIAQGSGFVYAVKYAVWTGSAWNTQTIEQGVNEHSNYTVWGDSLALDSTGRPHISYALNYLPSPCEHCVKYARWTGTAWDIQIVDQEGEGITVPMVMMDPDLVLDAADSPHVAYLINVGTAMSNRLDLFYAKQTSGTWAVQPVNYFVGGPASLALDTNSQPHIAYPGVYVYWTGAAWNIQTMPTDTVRQAALDLAPDGSAHILEQSDCVAGTSCDSGTLKYVRQLPALVLTKDASPKKVLAAGDALTYTLAFSGPGGQTVQLWDPLPEDVEYVPGSVTPSAFYNPTIRAIVWQGTLPTTTVQTISFQVTLTSTIDISTTAPAIVNTAWLTDTEYNKEVKAIAIVNGWHSFLPLIIR